jgi:2-hydroxy-3-oxopropionate reductase
MATIAFIGLGIMGGPMAGHLVQAGHTVIGVNRSPAPVQKLVEAGGRGAESVAEAVAEAEVIITMVPDSPDVEGLALGDDGIYANARSGAIHLDMSSIRPDVSVRLAEAGRERGIRVLDAPVSGGEAGAKEATLSIMVGGEEAGVRRAQPLFEVLGGTIVHVGGHGAGQVVKACNQVVVAVSIAAVSEALVLGSKAGVDPGRILDVLGGGLAANKVMEVRRRNFLEHDFTPGFRIDLHHKDLNIALESGDAYGVPLPVTGMVQQGMRALRARGHGGDDHSGLLQLVEELAAHRIGEPPPEG